jgi:hypothetical protein
MEGVVFLPSLFAMIFASPFSYTAIAEFVVPKSIPNTFAILNPYIYIYLTPNEQSPFNYVATVTTSAVGSRD